MVDIIPPPTPPEPIVEQPIPAQPAPVQAPAATPNTPPPIPVAIVPPEAAHLTIDRQSTMSAVDKAYGRE